MLCLRSSGLRIPFRSLKCFAFVKETVEIDVHGFARSSVKEDVLAMAVAKSDNVTNHGHDCRGAGVRQSAGIPG